MGTTCPYFKRSLRLGPVCSVVSYAAPCHPSMPIPAEKEINTLVLSAKTPKTPLHLPLALNSSWDGAWVIVLTFIIPRWVRKTLAPLWFPAAREVIAGALGL